MLTYTVVVVGCPASVGLVHDRVAVVHVSCLQVIYTGTNIE